MGRTNKSARNAGSTFERIIANVLKEYVSEFIDRKVRTGAKDKGDIANLRSPHNLSITAECKDYGGEVKITPWLKEVETERINDNSDIGVVFAKRRGYGDPLDQTVILSMRDFITLLTGKRP